MINDEFFRKRIALERNSRQMPVIKLNLIELKASQKKKKKINFSSLTILNYLALMVSKSYKSLLYRCNVYQSYYNIYTT